MFPGLASASWGPSGGQGATALAAVYGGEADGTAELSCFLLDLGSGRFDVTRPTHFRSPGVPPWSTISLPTMPLQESRGNDRQFAAIPASQGGLPPVKPVRL